MSRLNLKENSLGSISEAALAEQELLIFRQTGFLLCTQVYYVIDSNSVMLF
jgi:hypothetical protein